MIIINKTLSRYMDGCCNSARTMCCSLQPNVPYASKIRLYLHAYKSTSFSPGGGGHSENILVGVCRGT